MSSVALKYLSDITLSPFKGIRGAERRGAKGGDNIPRHECCAAHFIYHNLSQQFCNRRRDNTVGQQSLDELLLKKITNCHYTKITIPEGQNRCVGNAHYQTTG